MFVPLCAIFTMYLMYDLHIYILIIINTCLCSRAITCDYANSVLHICQKKHVFRLERVQNSFAIVVVKQSLFLFLFCLTSKAPFAPVQWRIRLTIATVTHKKQTYRLSITPCQPVAASQTYKVHAFFRHFVTVSATPQPRFRVKSLQT